MKRIPIRKTPQFIGKDVEIKGFITSIRDHGEILFVDLRDATGTIQLVLTKTARKKETPVKEWSVISVLGKVQKRPPQMINPDLTTGEIEILVEKLQIISQAKNPPFPIEGEGYEIDENLRLKYRYLDLRRKRLSQNLKIRQDFQNYIRQFLLKRKFQEIETPILTKATPEGARDFVVPSRIHPGKFYALPQSPQQYKQLLMVAGIERYFQFPRCFRDEDLRADRLLEFTQLDLEMSFVSQSEIMKLVEKLVIKASQYLGKKIQENPLPRLSYREALKKYKTDTPDLRKDPKNRDVLSYCWITDFPMFEKKQDGSLGASHHPFTAVVPEQKQSLLKFPSWDKMSPGQKKKLLQIKAQQYDLVLNGVEIAGGSIREHQTKALEKVFQILGYTSEEIQEKFGHLFEAFQFGVPPHGGIAFGFDRWLQVILGEKNIREVVAFPTSGRGVTSVMDSPCVLPCEQLKELGLAVKKSL